MKKIYRDEIDRLLWLAKGCSESNPAQARKYIHTAHKIRTRFRIALPPEIKQQYCKKCMTDFYSTKNVRYRISKGRVTRECLYCHDLWRVPIRSNKQNKK